MNDLRSSILPGLLFFDRATLATFLSLLQEATVFNKLYDGSRDYFASEAEANSFNDRLTASSRELVKSNLSNNDLALLLWWKIVQALGLEMTIISPHDVQLAEVRVAEKVSELVSSKKANDSTTTSDQESGVSWEKLKRAWKPTSIQLSFEEAAQKLLSELLSSLFENDPQQGVEVLSKIREALASQSDAAKELISLDDLSDDALKKMLVTGGGLVSVMGAVELVGFSAYILAAKASAIIPLVGGKTLVSLLAVVASPWFVIPAVIATGSLANFNANKAIRCNIAGVIVVLAALSGTREKIDKKKTARIFLEAAQYSPGRLARAVAGRKNLYRTGYARKFLGRHQAKFLRHRSLSLGSGIFLPQNRSFSENFTNMMSSSALPEKDDEDCILGILYPSRRVTEGVGYATLTFGDMLLDLASIDPSVVKAADFSRSADIEGPFDFAALASEIGTLSAASQLGHEANLLGYAAEQMVASRLLENGHTVSFPETANQAGYDLVVDGMTFQVKCIQEDNISILEEHFGKYPDIPVLVNAEVEDFIKSNSPEWAGQVYYVEGYTHENITALVSQSLDAGQELADFQALGTVAIVSLAHNLHDWWKGHQTLGGMSAKVALETSLRGTGAVAGGALGAGTGMIIFGPAGSYILSGIGTVFGATVTGRLTDKFDALLDPEREQSIKTACHAVLARIIEVHQAKNREIDQKIGALPHSELGEYITDHLEWEKVSNEGCIARAGELIGLDLPASKKLEKLAEFLVHCRVHPRALQKELKALDALLNRQADRLAEISKTIKKVSRWWDEKTS